MGATIIIASASHRRIARGRAWLEAHAPAEELLIVAPTLDAANELARTVVRTNGAAFGYHRVTLGQLAAAFATPALAARHKVPLGRLGVTAVANRAIHKLAERGELGLYERIAASPGFARAIAQVITELRLEQIASDALRATAPNLNPLLQAYEAELAERGFSDWPGVLYLAATAVADDRFANQLLGLPTLLLDLPVTTASELALVRGLCSRAPEMLITAPTSDGITIARLRGELGIEIVDLDSRPARGVTPSGDKLGSLARLQRHLFNESSHDPAPRLDDQVVIFSAPGESRECVEIARRILALARDGVAFARMAVLPIAPGGGLHARRRAGPFCTWCGAT